MPQLRPGAAKINNLKNNNITEFRKIGDNRLCGARQRAEGQVGIEAAVTGQVEKRLKAKDTLL